MFTTLTRLVRTVREDLRAVVDRDPAARRPAEALGYPGLYAVWAHRLWHRLDRAGHPLAARWCSQLSRLFTGVEIHPAAHLGRRVFIDHGAGVVIGETAAVGDDVTMYHGVTLGGDDPRPVKRHPTVEDGVTLGANSTLVGDVRVGEGATVGAGAVVVEDVPPAVTVVGNPARPVGSAGQPCDQAPDDDGQRC